MGKDWLGMLVTPGADWRVVGSDLDSTSQSEISHCNAIDVIAVQSSPFSLLKATSASRKFFVQRALAQSRNPTKMCSYRVNNGRLAVEY